MEELSFISKVSKLWFTKFSMRFEPMYLELLGFKPSFCVAAPTRLTNCLNIAVRKRRKAMEKLVRKLPSRSFLERRPSRSSAIHQKGILAEIWMTQNRRSRARLQFASEQGHMIRNVNQTGIISLFFHLNSCCIP